MLLALIALPIIAYRTSHAYVKVTIKLLVYIFGFGGWIWWIYSLIYWYSSVEPTLDGSEGAGPGFGWALVHFFMPMIAFCASIYALILSSLLERYKRYPISNITSR